MKKRAKRVEHARTTQEPEVGATSRDATSSDADWATYGRQPVTSSGGWIIRETDGQYHVVVETLHDIALVATPDAIVRFVSESVREVLGYEPSEVVGRSLPDFVPPEERGQLERVIDGVARLHERHGRYEGWALRKDGRRAYLRWNVNYLLAADGALREVQAIGRDVTEEQHAHDELEQRHRRLQVLYDVSSELAAAQDLPTALDKVLRRTAQEIGAQCGMVVLAQGEQIDALAHFGLPEQVMNRVRNMKRQARDLFLRRPWLVRGDGSDAEEVRWLVDEGRAIGLRSWMAVPLMTGEKRLGMFGVGSDSEARFTDSELDLLSAVANQVAVLADISLLHQRLHASEERLRLLVENIGDDVYQVDRAGRLVYWVGATERTLGYKPAEVLGDATLPRRICHPDDVDKVTDALAAAQQRGVPTYNLEFRARHKDGHFVFKSMSFIPVFDPTGAVVAVQGSSRDITEMKRREFELDRRIREQMVLYGLVRVLSTAAGGGEMIEAALRALADLLPDAVLSAVALVEEQDGTVRLANCRGGSPRFAKAWPADLRFRAGLLDVLRGEEAVLLSVSSLRGQTDLRAALDGEGVTDILVAPLSHKGRILGAILTGFRSTPALLDQGAGLFTAIGRQVAIALQNARVREREHMLALVVENAENRVAIVNNDLRVTYVNRAFERVYGFRRRDIVGRSIAMIYPGKTLESIPEPIRAALAQGKPFRAEVVHRAKDGRLVPIYLTGWPVRDEKGTVTGTVGIGVDLTEQKKSEERLRDAARLTSLGRLAAGVAHEVNTPLGVLNIDIQRLLKQAPKGSEQAATLEKMRRVVHQLSRIVENLLSFSRKREPMLVRQPLRPLVDRAVELLAERFHIEKKRCVAKVPSSLPLLEADGDQLQQVFVNLGVNALDAMKEGGTLRITARHRREEHEVEIAFSDTGPGLSARDAERVMEPFFTTKASGIGLGLAISHSIIENHHGTLSFKSTQHKGTTVTIRLPVAVNRRRAPSKGVSPRRGTSPTRRRTVT